MDRFRALPDTGQGRGSCDSGDDERPYAQALLKERFQLKTHRETRQSQICELTVAKGGLKYANVKLALTFIDRGLNDVVANKEVAGLSVLTRSEPGSCAPRDPHAGHALRVAECLRVRAPE